jgi:hypothetical protein
MARHHDSDGYISAKHTAVAMAQHTNQTRYVIEIDSGEGRAFTSCGEDYIDGPEYIAFDGMVYATVYPDGEIHAE